MTKAEADPTFQGPTINLLCELYNQYGADLVQARQRIGQVLVEQQTMGLEPMRRQFDDLEAEAMYLLLRSSKPEEAVEISPLDGWSSLWILSALRDNDAGRLTSFDLWDRSLRYIPEDLKARHKLVVGDVREDEDSIPEAINFLLIDSEHTRSFAKWYFKIVIPRVVNGAPVFIHDIETLYKRVLGTEANYVRRQLRARNIGYLGLGKHAYIGFAVRDILDGIARRDLGLSDDLSHSNNNPSVFFFKH